MPSPCPPSQVAVLKLPCQIAGQCQDFFPGISPWDHDNLASKSVMPKKGGGGGMEPMFLLTPLTGQPAGVDSSFLLP